VKNDISKFTGEAGRTLGVAVVDRLISFELPVTPAHYEVMFAYRTGIPMELVAEIEAKLARGELITHGVSEALYEKYFGNTRLSVQMVETGESIARELEQVVDVLRNAGAQTRDYGETLRSVADTNLAQLDASGFKKLVGQFLSATSAMVTENQRLLVQMDKSTRQVESLKTALQNVKAAALTDRLTGLANRRLFDETLHSKMAEARHNNAPLCLLMCDIDHFKRVNDTWGHVVGDQVIRYIAGILRTHTAHDCLAARYGGEEFAVIFPRTSIDRARSFAEGIQRAIRSKHLSRRSTGESIGAITISVGLAELRVSETASDLIERADHCLYFSKRNGRDRITTDAERAAAA
jgi:diguanylate cyclase